MSGSVVRDGDQEAPEILTELQKLLQKAKKHPNQTFGGNFVNRKVWGNFGQLGVEKKFGCSGFAVSFCHYGGGMPPIMKKMRLQTLNTQTFF